MIEQLSRIWRDQLPVLDGIAAATAWIFWILGVVTVDSATRQRDLGQAGALIVSAVAALVVAVCVARYKPVAKIFPSWVTVSILGSLVSAVITFGIMYLLSGMIRIDLSDLFKMQLLWAAIFAFLSLPVMLTFRIIFVGMSYLIDLHNKSLK